MKIVINACYGGFSISLDAARYMAERGHTQAAAEVAEYERKTGWIDSFLKTGAWPSEVSESERGFLAVDAKYHQKPTFHGYGYSDGFGGYKRDHTLLVEAVEKLGDKANGSCAKLKVVEVPDGVSYEIDEYDGIESIHEQHRSWA